VNRGERERKEIKNEPGGKRRGREEWTPVTLHANLTQPGCTTMTGDDGNENEEKRKKERERSRREWRERNGRARRE